MTLSSADTQIVADVQRDLADRASRQSCDDFFVVKTLIQQQQQPCSVVPAAIRRDRLFHHRPYLSTMTREAVPIGHPGNPSLFLRFP